MRRLAPLLLAAALATPAVADTPEKAAAFIDAMRAVGCDMSLEVADASAERLGIEIEELDDIIDLLFLGGQMTIDGEDHMTLVPALCEADAAGDAALYARLQAEVDLDAAMEPFFGAPPSATDVPTPERGALFLSAFRGMDCAVHREGAAAVMEATGLTPAEAETAVVVLFEAGHMQFGRGPEELRLSDAVCEADPSDDLTLFETASALVIGTADPDDADAVLADRFGPEGVEAVLEFLADTSDCVLDISDREDAVESVVAFLAFNVTGVYNLPPDFSPEAEDELRATIERKLDDPGPAFQAEPGQLTLIDCTP